MNRESSLRELTAEFARHEGRQPRVMVTSRAKGQEDSRIHEAAVLLANYGFNVDLGPAFRKEQELVSNALENDVDLLVLISTETGLPEELVRAIEDLLARSGRADLAVLGMPQDWTPGELANQLEASMKKLLRF